MPLFRSLDSRRHSAHGAMKPRFPNLQSRIHSLRPHFESLETRSLLTGFVFTDFSNSSGLNVVGDASISADHRLRLTSAEIYQIGSAWYTSEKPLVAGNFETTFQFQLHGGSDGIDGGSDGFALIIQNASPTELYAPGSALGYDRMPNSVAIEFDTKLDVSQAGDSISDPSSSHISVHTNGTGPNSANEASSLGAYTTPTFLLDDADVHTAKLTYAPGTLQIFLDDLTTPLLTVPLDLNTELNLDEGRAWIGFTGATSRSSTGYQNHDILNWSFQGDDNLIVADKPTVLEGANGSTASAQFTIRRIGSLLGPASVDWNTVNGTATGGSDFVAASGQVVFQDGESQKRIAVTVNGDNTVETQETFQLVLSTGTPGYTIASGQATILNEDTTVTINDDSVTEGNDGTRFIDDFVSAYSGGLTHARGAVFGPDANHDGISDLYATSFYTHQVLRYDGQTGEYLDVFVSSRSGGVEGPWAITFGPDGNGDGARDLYVGGTWSDNVVRYDGTTGMLIDEFVQAGSGGLSRPKGLSFDSQDNLYVSSGTNTGPFEVLRYRSDGSFMDVFVSDGSGGLGEPQGLTFGPDGNLYVTNANGVHRYNGTTGAFLNVFIADGIGGEGFPNFLEFRPDGYLYVTSQFSDEVLRYHATTGAFVDSLFPAGSGGLGGPFCLAFDEKGYLYVCSSDTSEILRYGPSSQAAFTVSLSAASALPVTVRYQTTSGTATGGLDFNAVSGTISFAPGKTTQTILIAIVDDTSIERNESLDISLSDVTGALLADDAGTATILDNDTKFYVVNDGLTASDAKSYEYGSDYAPGENYALNTANAVPRGVASTDEKVWVIDSNKRVFVYGPGGESLGSWAAGSIPGSPDIQGITTNGTDIWIVDAKSDKVFRYTNAASRLSGSQNAAGTFSLNRANSNPKDLVTDGTNLWVVDDSATDKVFKYTLTGSLVSSWTIATPNATKPTGITLDPSNPDHLWIVDSGTDRVYEYRNAISQRNGSSKPADASFALAPGNTDPQGIADPPRVSSVSGDHNLDGIVDLSDLELLCLAITHGTASRDEMDRFWSQRQTGPGDANFDHAFDSIDLVSVFQRGKYESQLPATWGEGDWNCDGEFNTQDLVSAFQRGRYEEALSAITDELENSFDGSIE